MSKHRFKLRGSQPVSNRKVHDVSYIHQIQDDAVLNALQEIRRISQRNDFRDSALRHSKEGRDEGKGEDCRDVDSVTSTLGIEQSRNDKIAASRKSAFPAFDNWAYTAMVENGFIQGQGRACNSLDVFADFFRGCLSLDAPIYPIECTTTCELGRDKVLSVKHSLP